MEDSEYKDLLEKYKARVREEFGATPLTDQKVTTREYEQFKQELYPTHLTIFEKACNISGNILKLKADPKKAPKVQKELDTAHLKTTPSGVVSLAIITALAIALLSPIVAIVIPIILGIGPQMILVAFMLAGAAGAFFLIQKFPSFMATTWRMKASNQMVQSIFYLVTYMRHTSNIERAIQFASQHLEAPLSLDFRKILWDVETQKFPNIRESANAYLAQWQEFNKEFVESFHLVESSLFEGAEDRRLTLLDKALEVVLNGTYENMLHYAHNLKAPMTMLHMLGVILPILGLVILPLVVSFMTSGTTPLLTILYIALLYNVALPVTVYALGRSILAKRPAGYGAVDISKKKGVKKFANVNISFSKKIKISINPLYFSLAVFAIATIIGLSPIIMHSLGSSDFYLDSKNEVPFLDYVCPPELGQNCEESGKVGPYGMPSSILSILFIVGLGGSIGLFYRLRSKNVIKIRRKTKLLEEEFSSALFQLGNRLGDGIPAEIAIAKVAKTMQGTTSGEFFNVTERNITKLGMGLEQALFNPKVGSVVSFPSKVIESSMKVLIESMKKGPRIAAQALLSMASYIKEIHRVEERLKDLMTDIISSMKAQVKFLTPAIAGIVIGITSMISTILTKLTAQLGTLVGGQGNASAGQFSSMLEIFGIGIPTFHFQIVVGIYIVQLAYILTVLSNGIENGADKLGERFELGKNMISGTMLYAFLAAVVMILFNLFAASIINVQLGA